MMRTIRAGALTSLISSYQMGSIPMSAIWFHSSVGQNEGLLILMSPVRVRLEPPLTGFFISLNFRTSLNKTKQGIACKGYIEGSFNGRTGDFDSLDVSSILAPSAIQIRTATHLLLEQEKFKDVGSSPTTRGILCSLVGQSIKVKTYLIYRECGVMVTRLLWEQESQFKSDIFDHCDYVAQQARATPCHGVGSGFESHHSRQQRRLLQIFIKSNL